MVMAAAAGTSFLPILPPLCWEDKLSMDFWRMEGCQMRKCSSSIGCNSSSCKQIQCLVSTQAWRMGKLSELQDKIHFFCNYVYDHPCYTIKVHKLQQVSVRSRDAHLNLDNSSLNKCPKPSGQACRPPPQAMPKYTQISPRWVFPYIPCCFFFQ